jgi:hypothetical protein
MFWALETVPKIVLISPRLRIASMTKARGALNSAPAQGRPQRGQTAERQSQHHARQRGASELGHKVTQYQ